MYTCCAERRIGSQKRLRRRSGDQVSQQQEAHRINNSEMNVAKKKRWLRGGELLESRDIYLKEEFPQRLILSCICSITVSSDLTLFFTSTCIYLHTYTHCNTYITSHHVTSHHICITLQNVSGTLCSLGDSLGFLFSLFSLLLATHWMFHLSFGEVFPLFLTCGFSFCAVFAIFWNMDVGFCILELQPVVWRDICSISPPK